MIEVPPGAQVSALTVGDKSLLVPGGLVTVAMTKAADGKNVAAWAWSWSQPRTRGKAAIRRL